MNVGTLKTLSYLSSLGLLGGIGYVGYDFWKNGQNQEFYDHERTTKLLGDVTPPPAPKRLGLNYNKDIKPAMLGFDWTGEPPAEPEPQKTQAEIEQETNRAREQLRGQVAALSLAGAEKVLGAAIDENAHRELVEKLASEL